jgi:transposase-like protein
VEELFAGRHFDRAAIILCVRWYLRYKLSLRDLVEMMAERGLQLTPPTILRRYAPEFIKRRNRFGRGSGEPFGGGKHGNGMNRSARNPHTC